jgi:heme/copper-type cytochrome/quinol oxidase subunit 1
VPLATTNSSTIDLMFFGLHLAGISSLASSFNFIATSISAFLIVFDFNYINLYIVSVVLTSFLLIISLPVLAGAITLIIFDRHFNTSFFYTFLGSDALFFQHLF